MLIRKMLWPTIKKKKVLFLAMILVVLIGSVISTAFSTSYFAFKKNTNNYINNYGYPDITLVTDEEFNDDLKDISIDGVEAIKPRTYFYKGTTRDLNPRVLKIISFTEDSFSKFVTLSETNDRKDDIINIYVDFSFAKNARINAGSLMDIYNDTETKQSAYVTKIVGNPETIFPMIQYGFQVDKYNFGYVFVEESELRKYYPEKSKYNEIIVKIKEGANVNKITNELKNKLKTKGISVDTTILKNESYTILYINNIVSYIYTASVVVPLIFSLIATLLMFLFLYQISKNMTKEMGILNALGVKKKSLFGLLFAFSLTVSIIGGFIGTLSGFGVANIIYDICRYSYSMPLGMADFNIGVTGVIFMVFILVSLLASLLTIFSLRKLSPKEAMIDNMDKNKPLPKCIDKTTKRSFSLNFAINSMHKNKVRFVIAVFAVMMSATTAYGALAYEESIKYYTNEISQRIKYDAQIYNLGECPIEDIKTILEDQKTQGNVTAIESYRSGVLKFTFNNVTVETIICAIEDDSSLVYIPGNIKVSDGGIALESSFANQAGVKVNDYIDVHVSDNVTKKVKVSAITNICADKYNYMNIKTYDEVFGQTYGYSSFLVNYINRNNLALALLSKNALPLYSKELIKTYTSGCELTLLTSRICIAIALSIGFITICIMSQASLLEQKRKFSTLRVLGLKNRQVFKISFFEMLLYFVLGTLIGIPGGVGLNALLILISSNERMTLSMFNPWWAFILAIALVILSLSLNLLVEFFSIKKWDIAKNTKTRE